MTYKPLTHNKNRSIMMVIIETRVFKVLREIVEEEYYEKK